VALLQALALRRLDGAANVQTSAPATELPRYTSTPASLGPLAWCVLLGLLLAGGVPAIGAKVTEEAGELITAADHETDDRVVSEAADLVYHMLVLLACRGIGLSQVEAELARRFGISGLDEKAARTGAGHQASANTPQRTDGATS
jgi:phosphoribosyl-ATP pyrophosphohydrolase